VFIAARCSIEVQAPTHETGGQDGFVKINSDTVWKSSPSRRGATIHVVDAIGCSIEESRTFDTHKSVNGSNELSTYLRQVSHGSIIVIVSADEPTHKNLKNALPALLHLGVDVSDVKYKGAFAFVAQQGFPIKTMGRKSHNGKFSPRIAVNVAGISCGRNYSRRCVEIFAAATL